MGTPIFISGTAVNGRWDMQAGTLEDKVIELERELCENRKGVVYRVILETIEKPIIEYALKRTEGNQLMAARMLGINRNTIRSKIKRLGIDNAAMKGR
jgi:two-component system nitrogen regulation response regulator GlnG